MSACASIRIATLVLLGLSAMPATASADWFLTPFLGSTFNGAGRGLDFEGSSLTYGLSLGFVPADQVFGFEFDLGVAPEFFEASGSSGSVDDSNAATFMGSVLVAAPGRIRPYGVGGVGLLYTNVTTPGGASNVDEKSFGVNFGGGVMALVSDRVGVRGDIRYFRGLRDDAPGEDERQLRFWRGSVGVTLKF